MLLLRMGRYICLNNFTLTRYPTPLPPYSFPRSRRRSYFLERTATFLQTHRGQRLTNPIPQPPLFWKTDFHLPSNIHANFSFYNHISHRRSCCLTSHPSLPGGRYLCHGVSETSSFRKCFERGGGGDGAGIDITA